MRIFAPFIDIRTMLANAAKVVKRKLLMRH
ncbi:hypothetical protein O166_18350 [Pseudogulbenkiania ferrooxidans EGD-HP2]|uniref:Uncharacterized protein n=1 Tax=Pseudogulbenkiania ferrooxidans EGD-HP2 TaxID=1388764 RepID=A0ABP2XSU1_9NEIS|nr:hypothetical protein O166_18350 [Pseudogulbenkiania ferrooxidans EGD-HP2]